MPDTIEERLRKLRAQQSGQSIEERLAALRAQQQQPPQDESTYQWLRRNAGLEGRKFMRRVADAATSGAEIVTSALSGDSRPLRETVELGARQVGQLFMAGAPAVGLPTPVQPIVANQSAMERVNEQRTARREAGPDAAYWRRSREDLARYAAQEAADPALSSRALRFGLGAAPYVGLGVLSGGSVPLSAGLGAAMELNTPENLVVGAALGAIPGGGARAGREAIRRTLGRGAEQIVEAEARAAPRFAESMVQSRWPRGMQAPLMRMPGEPLGTVTGFETAQSGLQAAISEAASEVPQSTMKRAMGELSSFPRAMQTAIDISAPGRQGLILSVAPSRWGAAIKAGREMFQAFSPKHYDRITREIASHADAPLAEKSGLYLALRQAEEFFTSKLAAKVPGVTRSQRAYETYLDSLRMSTFSQYKKLIDKAGLAPEQATRAYEAAAKWINYATGRGSLGKRFDDAVPLLSQFLFAPRYMASRFNVLNPLMYYRNFKDPATRIVAKQQMKDLAQYLGAVGLTMGLAKAAGLDVGLNPNKGDFLKIRWGSKVYDPGAGLVQVMRFAIRASHDLYRASKGEKAEWGKDAATLTERFVRSKLAPLPSYAWDFFSRRTYEGKPFTSAKDRAIGVVERITPLTWSDFTEALWNEGMGGALATLPGAVGIGVQSYNEPVGGFIEQAAPLLREYTRAGRQLPEIRHIKGEADQQFNARVKVFGEALQRYGVGLVESQEYRQADEAVKDRALILLPRRISSALIKQGESWQLSPRVLMSDVKENLELRRELERERTGRR